MLTAVFLIIPRCDAESNKAAAERQHNANNETEDPGKSSLGLSNGSNTGLTTELALGCHGVVRPAV